jgi:DNA modification methylase
MAVLAQATAAAVPLAAESVHCIVTSPPYYKQRRYNVKCDWPAVTFCPSPHLDTEWQVKPWRGELGWEPHPLDFVGHLLLAFRECRRVLRRDGHLWVNISDKRTADRQWASVPEMLLAALVADGWRHEDTVIWHKPAAMPGSQTNRFTRDFEKVYMLNKSTGAFFDIDAVRESFADATLNDSRFGNMALQANGRMRDRGGRGDGYTTPAGASGNPMATGRTRRTVWSISPKPRRWWSRCCAAA